MKFSKHNNLNPVFMKDILHYSANLTHKKDDLYIHTQNTTKFGNKVFGADMWNTCLNILSQLLDWQNFKKSLKHGQD